MDDLDLYDDLDEFQEQQEKKSKELQAAEDRCAKAQETIQKLELENKGLQKKIDRIQLSFQSLLDTARSEIKRKDKEIERLRKEKDDICFRRRLPNRPADVHDTVVPHRQETSAPLTSEVDRNVFNTKNSENHDRRQEHSSERFEESHKRHRSRDGHDSEKYKRQRNEKDLHTHDRKDSYKNMKWEQDTRKSDRESNNSHKNRDRQKTDYLHHGDSRKRSESRNRTEWRQRHRETSESPGRDTHRNSRLDRFSSRRHSPHKADRNDNDYSRKSAKYHERTEKPRRASFEKEDYTKFDKNGKQERSPERIVGGKREEKHSTSHEMHGRNDEHQLSNVCKDVGPAQYKMCVPITIDCNKSASTNTAPYTNGETSKPPSLENVMCAPIHVRETHGIVLRGKEESLKPEFENVTKESNDAACLGTDQNCSELQGENHKSMSIEDYLYADLGTDPKTPPPQSGFDKLEDILYNNLATSPGKEDVEDRNNKLKSVDTLAPIVNIKSAVEHNKTQTEVIEILEDDLTNNKDGSQNASSNTLQVVHKPANEIHDCDTAESSKLNSEDKGVITTSSKNTTNCEISISTEMQACEIVNEKTAKGTEQDVKETKLKALVGEDKCNLLLTNSDTSAHPMKLRTPLKSCIFEPLFGPSPSSGGSSDTNKTLLANAMHHLLTATGNDSSTTPPENYTDNATSSLSEDANRPQGEFNLAEFEKCFVKNANDGSTQIGDNAVKLFATPPRHNAADKPFVFDFENISSISSTGDSSSDRLVVITPVRNACANSWHPTNSTNTSPSNTSSDCLIVESPLKEKKIAKDQQSNNKIVLENCFTEIASKMDNENHLETNLNETSAKSICDEPSPCSSRDKYFVKKTNEQVLRNGDAIDLTDTSCWGDGARFSEATNFSEDAKDVEEKHSKPELNETDTNGLVSSRNADAERKESTQQTIERPVENSNSCEAQKILEEKCENNNLTSIDMVIEKYGATLPLETDVERGITTPLSIQAGETIVADNFISDCSITIKGVKEFPQETPTPEALIEEMALIDTNENYKVVGSSDSDCPISKTEGNAATDTFDLTSPVKKTNTNNVEQNNGNVENISNTKGASNQHLVQSGVLHSSSVEVNGISTEYDGKIKLTNNSKPDYKPEEKEVMSKNTLAEDDNENTKGDVDANKAGPNVDHNKTLESSYDLNLQSKEEHKTKTTLNNICGEECDVPKNVAVLKDSKEICNENTTTEDHRADFGTKESTINIDRVNQADQTASKEDLTIPSTDETADKLPSNEISKATKADVYQNNFKTLETIASSGNNPNILQSNDANAEDQREDFGTEKSTINIDPFNHQLQADRSISKEDLTVPTTDVTAEISKGIKADVTPDNLETLEHNASSEIDRYILQSNEIGIIADKYDCETHDIARKTQPDTVLMDLALAIRNTSSIEMGTTNIEEELTSAHNMSETCLSSNSASEINTDTLPILKPSSLSRPETTESLEEKENLETEVICENTTEVPANVLHSDNTKDNTCTELVEDEIRLIHTDVEACDTDIFRQSPKKDVGDKANSKENAYKQNVVEPNSINEVVENTRNSEEPEFINVIMLNPIKLGALKSPSRAQENLSNGMKSPEIDIEIDSNSENGNFIHQISNPAVALPPIEIDFKITEKMLVNRNLEAPTENVMNSIQLQEKYSTPKDMTPTNDTSTEETNKPAVDAHQHLDNVHKNNNNNEQALKDHNLKNISKITSSLAVVPELCKNKTQEGHASKRPVETVQAIEWPEKHTYPSVISQDDVKETKTQNSNEYEYLNNAAEDLDLNPTSIKKNPSKEENLTVHHLEDDLEVSLNQAVTPTIHNDGENCEKTQNVQSLEGTTENNVRSIELTDNCPNPCGDNSQNDVNNTKTINSTEDVLLPPTNVSENLNNKEILTVHNFEHYLEISSNQNVGSTGVNDLENSDKTQNVQTLKDSTDNVWCLVELPGKLLNPSGEAQNEAGIEEKSSGSDNVNSKAIEVVENDTIAGDVDRSGMPSITNENVGMSPVEIPGLNLLENQKTSQNLFTTSTSEKAYSLTSALCQDTADESLYGIKEMVVEASDTAILSQPQEITQNPEVLRTKEAQVVEESTPNNRRKEQTGKHFEGQSINSLKVTESDDGGLYGKISNSSYSHQLQETFATSEGLELEMSSTNKTNHMDIVKASVLDANSPQNNHSRTGAKNNEFFNFNASEHRNVESFSIPGLDLLTAIKRHDLVSQKVSEISTINISMSPGTKASENDSPARDILSNETHKEQPSKQKAEQEKESIVDDVKLRKNIVHNAELDDNPKCELLSSGNRSYVNLKSMTEMAGSSSIPKDDQQIFFGNKIIEDKNNNPYETEKITPLSEILPNESAVLKEGSINNEPLQRESEYLNFFATPQINMTPEKTTSENLFDKLQTSPPNFYKPLNKIEFKVSPILKSPLARPVESPRKLVVGLNVFSQQYLPNMSSPIGGKDAAEAAGASSNFDAIINYEKNLCLMEKEQPNNVEQSNDCSVSYPYRNRRPYNVGDTNIFLNPFCTVPRTPKRNNSSSSFQSLNPSSSVTDAYGLPNVLPSISTKCPTPPNFSGLFSKKNFTDPTCEDGGIMKAKKKSPKLKSYIIPATSVLCNMDNLQSATKASKKLHWEMLESKNDMTQIDDDTDVISTDEELQQRKLVIKESDDGVEITKNIQECAKISSSIPVKTSSKKDSKKSKKSSMDTKMLTSKDLKLKKSSTPRRRNTLDSAPPLSDDTLEQFKQLAIDRRPEKGFLNNIPQTPKTTTASSLIKPCSVKLSPLTVSKRLPTAATSCRKSKANKEMMPVEKKRRGRPPKQKIVEQKEEHSNVVQQQAKVYLGENNVMDVQQAHGEPPLNLKETEITKGSQSSTTVCSKAKNLNPTEILQNSTTASRISGTEDCPGKTDVLNTSIVYEKLPSPDEHNSSVTDNSEPECNKYLKEHAKRTSCAQQANADLVLKSQPKIADSSVLLNYKIPKLKRQEDCVASNDISIKKKSTEVKMTSTFSIPNGKGEFNEKQHKMEHQEITSNKSKVLERTDSKKCTTSKASEMKSNKLKKDSQNRLNEEEKNTYDNEEDKSEKSLKDNTDGTLMCELELKTHEKASNKEAVQQASCNARALKQRRKSMFIERTTDLNDKLSDEEKNVGRRVQPRRRKSFYAERKMDDGLQSDSQTVEEILKLNVSDNDDVHHPFVNRKSINKQRRILDTSSEEEEIDNKRNQQQEIQTCSRKSTTNGKATPLEETKSNGSSRKTNDKDNTELPMQEHTNYENVSDATASLVNISNSSIKADKSELYDQYMRARNTFLRLQQQLMSDNWDGSDTNMGHDQFNDCDPNATIRTSKTSDQERKTEQTDTRPPRRKTIHALDTQSTEGSNKKSSKESRKTTSEDTKNAKPLKERKINQISKEEKLNSSESKDFVNEEDLAGAKKKHTSAKTGRKETYSYESSADGISHQVRPADCISHQVRPAANKEVEETNSEDLGRYQDGNCRKSTRNRRKSMFLEKTPFMYSDDTDTASEIVNVISKSVVITTKTEKEIKSSEAEAELKSSDTVVTAMKPILSLRMLKKYKINENTTPKSSKYVSHNDEIVIEAETKEIESKNVVMNDTDQAYCEGKAKQNEKQCVNKSNDVLDSGSTATETGKIRKANSNSCNLQGRLEDDPSLSEREPEESKQIPAKSVIHNDNNANVTTVAVATKSSSRKRRVVKVISSPLQQSEGQVAKKMKHAADELEAQPVASSSPDLNHPIFDTHVVDKTQTIHNTTPIWSNDEGYKEMDSRLRVMFQSPQHDKEPIGIVADDSLLATTNVQTDVTQSNLTIEETVLNNCEEDKNSVNNTSSCDSKSLNASLTQDQSATTKQLSLGTTNYRFEKVSENVVNLFISRKRKRAKPKAATHTAGGVSTDL